MKDPRIERVRALIRTLENALDQAKEDGSYILLRKRDWQAILNATGKVVDAL